MEVRMPDYDDLIDRYIATWNETDGERRRDLVARTFTKDASYVDPHFEGYGAGEIDALIGAVQQRFPGYRFRCAGRVDAHHDRVRFCWEVMPAEGPVFAAGTDIATVADGRFRSVTGFIDQMAGA
jgi:hypothetical protein